MDYRLLGLGRGEITHSPPPPTTPLTIQTFIYHILERIGGRQAGKISDREKVNANSAMSQSSKGLFENRG